MKIHTLLAAGLLSLVLLVAAAGPAGAQINYGIGGRMPFGTYGPYVTRPFGGPAFGYPGGSSLYGFGTYGGYPYSPLASPYGSYYGGAGYGAYYGSPYSSYYGSPYGSYYGSPYGSYYGSPYGYPGYYPGDLYGYVGPAGLPYAPGSLYADPYLYGGGYSSYYSPLKTNISISNSLDKLKSGVSSVKVKVPDPNAEVWFGGVKTKQTGTDRDFVTPELQPGKKYKYQVKAIWTEKGVLAEHNKTVEFQVGQNVNIDFTAPSVNDKPGEKKAPPDTEKKDTPEKK